MGLTVSIVNVTSYTGLELLRLLAEHPQFTITSVTGRSSVGKHLGAVFPQLRAIHGSAPGLADLLITEAPAQTDLAFVCLPHAAAAEAVQDLLSRDIKVVDLSADFRLRDPAQYTEWYHHTHPAPTLLETAVYGLCERYRPQIAGASLVANPGCHATAAILGLLPALSAGLVGPDIIIDSKSGLSGAGRGLSQSTHFADANEDVSAYSLGGHRHLAEIIQELTAAAQEGTLPPEEPLRVTFVPHLIPMTRGILSTCYAQLLPSTLATFPSATEVSALYKAYYADAPFVHVIDHPPHTKWAYGSNYCLIYPTIDPRTRRLVVVACLDNLVKGASGQAIQNANCLLGLPETTGLPALAIYP